MVYGKNSIQGICLALCQCGQGQLEISYYLAHDHILIMELLRFVIGCPKEVMPQNRHHDANLRPKMYN